MEWLKKLSAAIDYIENNLDGDISYDEAAKIACCSTFYFQRIFSYVAGVSLSEYIRRRRMTQAAFELQRTGAKVIDMHYIHLYKSYYSNAYVALCRMGVCCNNPLLGRKGVIKK